MIAPPLLAFDLLEALGPLLLVVFWVLRQVLSGGGVDEKAELPRPRRPQPVPDPNAVEEEPALRGFRGEDQAHRDEVDEFLRRVGQRRDPNPEDADIEERPPSRRPVDPFDEPRPETRRARERVVARGSGEIELLVDPEAPADPEVSHGSVGHLAEQHLAESQLAEQAAHLGERIAQADAAFDTRLHEKFDHRLGRLAAAEAESPADRSPTADEPPAERRSSAHRIAEMLAKPGGFRDAVVLSEILNRRADVLENK